ncbi:DUF2470 domain-containing protein [Nocardioides bruguierae]|uniref:DUF2470 domain-containing protein n=1 Tax=Nocardioides bruguierae TaxID=2945102 RepID=UPI0020201E3A|nr:DUF2470 domain-containing protein [Nocardioides bruguierae]MCL8024677.1 DUF2470 domain-containing protein [Nocardioides bruguierae]
MTLHRAPSTDVEAARAARSVLAAPARASLHLATPAQAQEPATAPLSLAGVSLVDDGGRPHLLVPTDHVLVAAAREGLGVRLWLAEAASGELLPGGVEAARLDLHGTLALADVEAHGDQVTLRLEVATVVLHRSAGSVPVDVSTFSAPDLALNAGHLARCCAHANASHGDLLREAVGRLVGRPEARMIAASLTSMDADGAVVAWIDHEGAHERRVPFVLPAEGPEDLGPLLRDALGLALH